MNVSLQRIYDYFWHTKEGDSSGCGLWHIPATHDGCCHVARAQVLAYSGARREEGRALFLPEPACGDPSNEVLFVGINPGQRKQNESTEFEWCLNTMRNPHLCGPLTRDSYIDYYVNWYRDNVDSPKYIEPITQAALRILSLAYNIAPDVELLHKLTILNIGHCKSPPGIHLKAGVLDRCGRASLDYVVHSAARVVVCLGPQVWENWLTRAIFGNARAAPWTGELEECGVVWQADVQNHTRTGYGDGFVVGRRSNGKDLCFVRSYHPSNHAGQFKDVAQTVAMTIARFLA